MIILWEAIQTDHYLVRKKQRGTIVDIQINNPQAYKNYDVNLTNSKLIPILQKELNNRLQYIETVDFGESGEFNLGVVFFFPILRFNQQGAPINMTVNNGDQGMAFLTIVMSNKLATMYPQNKLSKIDIENSVNRHLKNNNKENGKLPKAANIPGYKFEIDIDELYGKKKQQEKEPELIQPKVSEDSLDYEVRTDYRVGANFNHDKYGEGKVVAAASGGKAGVNGVVDWIDVKYPKPFLKGGKLQDTRRFTDVLTKAYFGKTKKQ